jgi:glutathione peroxidase-family protein
MGGACSIYGRERRGVYKVLVGKLKGKRPLGRRWDDNIKWTFRKWDVGA